MTDWQLIETAPKDGSRILLFDEEIGAVIGWWFTGWEDGNDSFKRVTHWMPLPAPPEHFYDPIRKKIFAND